MKQASVKIERLDDFLGRACKLGRLADAGKPIPESFVISFEEPADKVVDLPGERVLRARAIVRALPQLSVHDGFAFALAESHSGCILLSGDDMLRTLATRHSIEVHGVLWLLDEVYRHRLASAPSILAILRIFSEDVTVRLPRRELTAYFKKYEGLA
jgi:hypothetical protein